MPRPKPTEPHIMVSVRLPVKLAKRIDEYAERMPATDEKASSTRSDAVKALLALALNAADFGRGRSRGSREPEVEGDYLGGARKAWTDAAKTFPPEERKVIVEYWRRFTKQMHPEEEAEAEEEAATKKGKKTRK